MKNILFVLVTLILITPSFGQINVTHVKEGATLTDKQGLFYTLPNTLIQVKVKVLKTEYIAGPYSEYASKYLDLADVNTSDYNEYEIIDLKLSTESVPDPDHVYFAEITEKFAKAEKSVLLSLSSAGMAMDLLGNLPGKPLKDYSGVSVKSATDKDDFFKYFAETNLFEQFDTIIRKVVVDTITVEKMYFDSKWVEKSDEQKAVEAANKISRIREARFNLLTGYQEIPYEAEALAYMDTQLEKMESEYLSLFTGVSLKKKLVYSFSVKPQTMENSRTIPVFVFSERSGLKDVSAAGGEVVNLKIEAIGNYGVLNSVTESRNTSGNEKGFFYRIPVMAKVKIKISNDLQTESVIPIGQFGPVSYLPPNVTSVQFHPETGGVKTILLD